MMIKNYLNLSLLSTVTTNITLSITIKIAPPVVSSYLTASLRDITNN